MSNNISVNPIKYITATKLIQGEYPFWIPHLMGGTPLYSGIGVFDIFQFIHALFPPVDAFIIGAFVAICLGSIGMYFLLNRCFLCGCFCSFVGACVFGANPFAGSRLIDSTSFLMPHLFIPWIFYCLYTSVRKKALFWAMLGAIPFSMTYYSGNIQSTAFIILFLLFYLVCYVVLAKGVYQTEVGGMLKGMAAAFFFSGLLMAAEVLPMLELIKMSSRSAAENFYIWKTLVILISVIIYFALFAIVKKRYNLTDLRAHLYVFCITFSLFLAASLLLKPERLFSLFSYLKTVLEKMFFIPSMHFSEERFDYFPIGYWLRAITLPLVFMALFFKKTIEENIFLAVVAGYSLLPYALFNSGYDRLAFIPMFSLSCVVALTLDRLFKLQSRGNV